MYQNTFCKDGVVRKIYCSFTEQNLFLHNLLMLPYFKYIMRLILITQVVMLSHKECLLKDHIQDILKKYIY